MAKDAGGLPYVRLGLCYSDLTIGRRFRTIGRTVTEADIVNFINCTGTAEVLFLSLDFLARESDIKGRVAPDVLGYTFAEGSAMQATMPHTSFAFLGTDLKIEHPLFASDTIHVEVEAIEARLSQSRRGPVRTRNRVVGRTAPWLSPTRRCAWSGVLAPAEPEA
jgi:acyl dehydratase